jgi:hypothetical protein
MAIRPSRKKEKTNMAAKKSAKGKKLERKSLPKVRPLSGLKRHGEA